MNWKDKLGEANKLFEQVKAILAKGDEAEPSEKENLQVMLDDAKALKREAMQLQQVEEGLTIVSPDVLTRKEGPAPEDKKVAPDRENTSAGPVAYKDWGEWLHAIWMQKAHSKIDSRLKWFADDEPEGHKAMAGSTGARGGFLIPTQFIPQMQAVAAEDAIVRPNATVIRMARRQVAIPVLDQTGTTAGVPNWFGGMKFYWADEGEEKTDTDAKFRRVNLVAKKLIGYTNASDELLDDAAISLGDFLSGPLGFAGGIVWMEDYAFLRGVGGGQPRGVINAPVTLAPARQAAGTIGYIDCINMLQNFLPTGRGQWCVTQSALANLIQMNGPAANPSYVWQPSARDGVPGMLFGMPVKWSEKMAGIGTQGDILLADFRYYLIGDRQATTVESSQYPRWVYDETTWRAVHRVDGPPWLSAPLTYSDGTTQISPFVVLGDAAGS